MPIVQGNPISILVLKGEKGDSGEGAGNISFANITGNPEDNEALSEALSTKLEAKDLDNVSHKQDVKDLTNNNNMSLIGIFNKLGINIENEILLIAFEKFFPVGSNIIWNNTKNPNKIFPYNKGTWELTSKGKSIVGRYPGNYKYSTPGTEVGSNSVNMPKHKHKVSVWDKIENGSWDKRSLIVGNAVELITSRVSSLPSPSTTNNTIDKAFFYATIEFYSPGEGATSRLVIGEKDAPFDENAEIPIEPLGEVKSIWTRIE